MSASKNFIKNAVGILIVVAICFVAVTIYKKGNASINSSISNYDEIVSQFENAKFTMYDNTTASGNQIIELLKGMKKEDEVMVVVSNGYTLKNKEEPQKYNYESVFGENETTMAEVTDKKNAKKYINPNALFYSYVTYDDNNEISAVVFEQKK